MRSHHELAARNKVSLGIDPAFRTGTGEALGDCIVHSALTPIPVVPGQAGFTPMSRADDAEPADGDNGRAVAPIVFQLATDDTYTTAQVVSLAGSLAPASIPVPPPFTLDLAPAGLPVDTITLSTMSFGAEFRTVLRKHRPLTSPNRMVGAYQASLAHSAAGVTLDVDVTDWNATLEITVGAGITMTDAELLRYAAGVHILNRSDPE